MSHASVSELDLLGFFGVEPMYSHDEDIPWAYRQSAYVVECGGTAVSFTIYPACNDLHIILKRDGVTYYELDVDRIEDIRYHNDSGRETVEIVVSESNKLWLRLYPHVSITQHCTLS